MSKQIHIYRSENHLPANFSAIDDFNRFIYPHVTKLSFKRAGAILVDEYTEKDEESIYRQYVGDVYFKMLGLFNFNVKDGLGNDIGGKACSYPGWPPDVMRPRKISLKDSLVKRLKTTLKDNPRDLFIGWVYKKFIETFEHACTRINLPVARINY